LILVPVGVVGDVRLAGRWLGGGCSAENWAEGWRSGSSSGCSGHNYVQVILIDGDIDPENGCERRRAIR
jgi:hypothetical protein